MDYAFTFLEKESIDTEESYPYKGTVGTCGTGTAVSKVTGFHDVTPNDPVALQAAVATGPVSIALDAAGPAFQLYFKGIILGLCGTSLDHGVLVVGYGSSKTLGITTDYWIVKNSWGASWGESGYVRIRREMKKSGPGVCGLQQSASYPLF